MEPQPAIRTGVTASAIAHLSILALVLFLSDVRPFGAVTAETIAVDIVTPQEVVPEKSEPPVPLPPDLSVLTKEAATAPSAAPQPAAAAPSQPMPAQQQASSPVPAKNQRVAASAPKAEVGSAAATYAQPQPDITVKYNVMLGLPPELPTPTGAGAGEKPGDGYDASAASVAADVSSGVVAEFRRHLKTCSKLPASVTPSDKVLVKLRVFMTQDGRLAGDPVVGGGSANIKAIELLQSAIAALKACQPYAMLPPDRYGEWKALDLTFTPGDFRG